MVNNQNEFNKEYSKEIEEIELENKDFEGQLIIEGYSELKDLYLRVMKSIDKITLKNLTQLQECTIWDCGVEELVIENCPQIKILNVRNNSLTNLEFLKDLDNLKELELDGNDKIDSGLNYLPSNLEKFSYENTELTKFLKPDWETCKKEIKKLIERVEREPQRVAKDFWDLDKRHKDLKNKSWTLLQGKKEDFNGGNIKTKELFSKLKQEFKDKEVVINQLENQVWKLTELSKKQREEVQTHLDSFGLEKALLEELVMDYLKFVKFEKQGINSPNYNEELEKMEEKYKSVKKNLQSRLPKESEKENMNKVQRILVNCREIEIKLGEKDSLIDEQKNQISQVTDDNKKSGEIIEFKNKLKKQEENQQKQIFITNNFFGNNNKLEIGDRTTISNQFTYNINYNYNKELAKQELTGLEKDYWLIVNEPSSDPQKLKKSVLFLGTKQIFATTRQGTIDNLSKTHENADESGKKYDKIALVGNYIGEVKEIASLVPGGGIVTDILSKGIPTIANLLKSRSIITHSQEFGDYLIEDEKALSLLEKTYQSLVASQDDSKKVSPILTNLLKFNQSQLNQHSVFEVSKLEKERKPTSEEMSKAIELLNNHLQEFKKELGKEIDEYKEKMEELFATEEGKFLQEELIKLLEKLSGQERDKSQELSLIDPLEDLQGKIKDKETYLQSLVADAKNKLKIRFLGFSERRYRKLNNLLNTQAEIVHLGNTTERQKEMDSLKKQLLEIALRHDHKDFEIELNKLCQVQAELTKSQMELEELQNKQWKAQIISSASPNT